MYRQYFPAAGWSVLLRCLTFLSMAILVGVFTVGILTGPQDLWVWQLSMTGIPLAVVLISPLFIVRGYLLEEGNLRVQRLGWFSTIDLRQLETVRHDPEAMRGAWRLFGNGGLFCFAGLFRSKRLGNFRAFVTSAGNSVIIRTAQRTWVVSPSDPEALVTAIDRKHGVPSC